VRAPVCRLTGGTVIPPAPPPAGFADFSDLFNDDDMDTKPIAEVLPAVKTEPRAARSSETSVPLQMQAAAPLLPAQMLLQSQLLMNPVLGMGLPMFNPALYQATSGAEACLPSAGQATCGAAGAAGTHAVKHKVSGSRSSSSRSSRAAGRGEGVGRGVPQQLQVCRPHHPRAPAPKPSPAPACPPLLRRTWRTTPWPWSAPRRSAASPRSVPASARAPTSRA
jgi:hypothetical protein